MARLIKLILLFIAVVLLIVWAIFDLRGSAAVRRQLTRIEEAGESVNWENFVPPPAPDEENAAVVYQRAFRLMEYEGSDTENCLICGLLDDSPWDETKRKRLVRCHTGIVDASALGEAAAWQAARVRVGRNEEVLKLIRRAAAMDRCWFDIKGYTNPMVVALPHLDGVRDGARLMVLSARLSMRNGQLAQSYGDLVAAIDIERATRQPDALPYVTGNLIVHLALMTGLQPIVAADARHPEQWRTLLRQLAALASTPRLLRLLQAERAKGLAMFDRHTPGWTIARRHPWGFVLRPWAKRGKAEYLRYMTDLLEAAKRLTWEGLRAIPELERRAEDSSFWSWIFFLGEEPKFIRYEAEYQTWLALAKVALALKLYKHQHSRYPDRLASLAPGILKTVPKDPFTGRPLMYRRIGQGFIVYSVGGDLEDNGGNETPPDQCHRRQGVDIVWKAEQ